ncbi:MAG: type III-B CRISPR-associated protein Cas10/Cmr2, partial [Ottowia sp.]|nr:type III-B CRISPR-associated protein Cas10/Cmr2 [Ottowia sp.]
WPMLQGQTAEGKTFAYAPWAQVRWTKEPKLIHPLSGAEYDLHRLSETDFKDIRQRSKEHVFALLDALNLPALEGRTPADWRRALLALWRFAPELREDNDFGKLGALWKLLPADTRIPDHSIWDHLDLVSAFAGAFAADPQGEAALLTLSIGPVQPFIAAARKMEDLWAGSHLLSRLSWEAMRVVCERLGPDAILFPRLRGVPQVDAWLYKECSLPEKLFKNCEWKKSGNTDANPLFAAALPNRFVAAVPASQAQDIARAVEQEARRWMQEQGEKTIQLLLNEAGIADSDKQAYCWQQMREQLEGFPEVHWAAVPFSLIATRDKEHQHDLDTTALTDAMRPFFGAQPGQPCGFLATPAWKLLSKELQAKGEDGTPFTFFAPNPGVLYPAIYDLAERALAAAKTLRPFDQSAQRGWRCTLSGEAEWLTHDESLLHVPAGMRTGTLWQNIAAKRPAWAKKGEYLSALPAIKRLWPTLFAEEVGSLLDKGGSAGRFMVSTHTMALAHQLGIWLEKGGLTADGFAKVQEKHRAERAALPRRLLRRYRHMPDELKDAAQLPALLDMAAEMDNTTEAAKEEIAKIQRIVKSTLARGRDDGKDIQLETYYALIKMDGDNMGAWLSGSEEKAIRYLYCFHPEVCAGFKNLAAQNADIKAYRKQKRPVSPGRHLAISAALNDFSLSVVRHIVEQEYLGRLIYAGGDDVFAMLPVADLLRAMQRLNCAWQGHDPAPCNEQEKKGLVLKDGFALLLQKQKRGKETRKHLMRMMGTTATASCGAVIAHHQAPLTAVIRELNAAEHRAKSEGGRDAFSITVLKRSGGALRLTAKWGKGDNDDEPSAPDVLHRLRLFLAADGVSRRAAYHTLQWLNARQLPALDESTHDMFRTLLAQQFAQQAKPEKKDDGRKLAEPLLQLARREEKAPDKRINWLRSFISTAEFLAREVRTDATQEEDDE